LKPERLIRIALTSCRKNPALLECDPHSFIGALMLSAQLGLEPDDGLGEAYLIPRNNRRKGIKEVNFQPGYKGLVKLAQNSGQIASIACNVVREGDFLEYEKGILDKLVHRESPTSFDAPITHAWAVAKTQNGGVYWDCWPVQKIEAHRKRYAPDSYDGYSAWGTNYDWMAMKTVLIQALKLAPKSVELQRAVALNEQSEAGLPQDNGIDFALDVTPPAPASSKTPLQQLTESMTSGAQAPEPKASTNALSELIGEVREFEEWALESGNPELWTRIRAEAGVHDARNLKSLGVVGVKPLVEAIRSYRRSAEQVPAPAPVQVIAPRVQTVDEAFPPIPKSFHDQVSEIVKDQDRQLMYDLIVKHGGQRGTFNFSLGLEQQNAFLGELRSRVSK
jgi:recombination protein RecT